MQSPEEVARDFCRRMNVHFRDAPTVLANLIRRERGRAFEAGVDAKTPYRHPEFGTLTPDISAHRRAAVEGRKEGEGDAD